MDLYTVILGLTLVAGFFMAFSLGANDVANSMASAVGSKAITARQAVIIAGSLNFIGATLLGAHVTSTISKGIIDPAQITDPNIMMLGMLAALPSAGLWVLVATLTALPVSSTHSIVGSILGFGLVAGGQDVVHWFKLTGIVLSWIISPFFGGLVAFFIFSLIRRRILYQKSIMIQVQVWAPRLITATGALLAFSFFYKTPAGSSLPVHWTVKFLCVLAACAGLWFLGKRYVLGMLPKVEQGLEGVEAIFRKMQLGTSCYVAISQGANDVANAIGPVAAIYMVARQNELLAKVEVPWFLLVLGGVGITLGIVLLGYKVMETVGEKITELHNTRGFSVDFGAATTVLLASLLGMPVSTTHAAVGSVVGVGLARGFGAVDFRVLWRIVLYWVLTVPIAAFTSIIIFQVLKWMIL